MPPPRASSASPPVFPSGISRPICSPGHDVIVDAMLGTGLEREVEGEWRAAIEAINASRLPVLAVDVPSGLNADTGHVMGAAVRASATMSFIGLKAGLFTGAGREHAGEIFFNDLDVPPDIYRQGSGLGATPDGNIAPWAHAGDGVATCTRAMPGMCW